MGILDQIPNFNPFFLLKYKIQIVKSCVHLLIFYNFDCKKLDQVAFERVVKCFVNFESLTILIVKSWIKRHLKFRQNFTIVIKPNQIPIVKSCVTRYAKLHNCHQTKTYSHCKKQYDKKISGKSSIALSLFLLFLHASLGRLWDLNLGT